MHEKWHCKHQISRESRNWPSVVLVLPHCPIMFRQRLRKFPRNNPQAPRIGLFFLISAKWQKVWTVEDCWKTTSRPWDGRLVHQSIISPQTAEQLHLARKELESSKQTAGVLSIAEQLVVVCSTGWCAKIDLSGRGVLAKYRNLTKTFAWHQRYAWRQGTTNETWGSLRLGGSRVSRSLGNVLQMIDDCSTLGIIPKLKDNFTLSFSMGIHNNNRLADYVWQGIEIWLWRIFMSVEYWKHLKIKGIQEAGWASVLWNQLVSPRILCNDNDRSWCCGGCCASIIVACSSLSFSMYLLVIYHNYGTALCLPKKHV